MRPRKNRVSYLLCALIPILVGLFLMNFTNRKRSNKPKLKVKSEVRVCHNRTYCSEYSKMERKGDKTLTVV